MASRKTVWIGIVCLVLLPLIAACGSKKEIPPATPTEETEAVPEKPAETDRTGTVPEERERTVDPSETYDFLNVYFEFDKHRLTSEAQAILTEHAKILIGKPDWTVRIEGHCDERGTVEYNLALGEKRAKTAKDFLVRYGISAANVSVISYGKERPIDGGHTDMAWAKNRRAEFHVQR